MMSAYVFKKAFVTPQEHLKLTSEGKKEIKKIENLHEMYIHFT